MKILTTAKTTDYTFPSLNLVTTELPLQILTESTPISAPGDISENNNYNDFFND